MGLVEILQPEEVFEPTPPERPVPEWAQNIGIDDVGDGFDMDGFQDRDHDWIRITGQPGQKALAKEAQIRRVGKGIDKEIRSRVLKETGISQSRINKLRTSKRKASKGLQRARDRYNILRDLGSDDLIRASSELDEACLLYTSPSPRDRS